MTHEHEPTREWARNAGRCLLCGKAFARLQAHHVFRRGGGNTLDIRVNLAGLCLVCHRQEDDGHIARIDIIKLVAAREHTDPDCIEPVIRWLQRLDKHASPDRVRLSMCRMRPSVQKLAARVWREVQEAREAVA